MANLCIRIVPNAHPTDPSLDPFRTQEGDVVAVTDDAHVFSVGELTCGQYRFIRVPGVSQADLIYLIESVYAADDATLLRRRKVSLDAAVLKGGVWKNRTEATKAKINLITIVKT